MEYFSLDIISFLRVWEFPYLFYKNMYKYSVILIVIEFIVYTLCYIIK
jgi:hypothetical protein